MSDSSAIPPGQDHHDLHALQPWMRLYEGGQRVGYAWQVREDQWLYSVDGYGWTSQPIPSDQRVPQIPYQLYSQRVFHGDLVKMTTHSGAQTVSEKIVLLGPDRNIYLCDAAAMTIDNLQDLWPPPSRPRIERIIGSVSQDRERMALIERRLGSACGADPSYRLKLALLTLAIASGMGLTGYMQKVVVQHVGPLTTMAGGFFGAILFWWMLRRWDWHALRRQVILKMSFQTSLLLGGLGASLFPLFNSARLSELSATVTLLHMAAGGMLGFLTGLICGIIGAELVTWRTGGYAGEGHKPLGFRAL